MEVVELNIIAPVANCNLEIWSALKCGDIV